jgi:hypothetical protein
MAADVTARRRLQEDAFYNVFPTETRTRMANKSLSWPKTVHHRAHQVFIAWSAPVQLQVIHDLRATGIKWSEFTKPSVRCHYKASAEASVLASQATHRKWQIFTVCLYSVDPLYADAAVSETPSVPELVGLENSSLPALSTQSDLMMFDFDSQHSTPSAALDSELPTPPAPLALHDPLNPFTPTDSDSLGFFGFDPTIPIDALGTFDFDTGSMDFLNTLLFPTTDFEIAGIPMDLDTTASIAQV